MERFECKGARILEKFIRGLGANQQGSSGNSEDWLMILNLNQFMIKREQLYTVAPRFL
jgi:hypothetical protein